MPHGNFGWHELYTRDVEAAKAFYAATVGWMFEGMPMPEIENCNYRVAKAGDKPVAGVLDMRGIVPDADPPHWLSYLEVHDVDRLVAEVRHSLWRQDRSTAVRRPRVRAHRHRGRRDRRIHGLGDLETLAGTRANLALSNPPAPSVSEAARVDPFVSEATGAGKGVGRAAAGVIPAQAGIHSRAGFAGCPLSRA